MQRARTFTNAVRKTPEWGKVSDDKGQRVRGLWLRRGIFYAQMCPSGQAQPYKYPLHNAHTVPQAITAMQVLKAEQKKGKLPPPAKQIFTHKEKRDTPSPGAAPDSSPDSETGAASSAKDASNARTIRAAIAEYQKHRNDMQLFDPLTRDRQDNAFNKWTEKFGDQPVTELNEVMRQDYAKWRLSKEGGKVVGRTIDIDVSAMNHVVERIVALKWLPTNPLGKWKKLAKKSKKTRLLQPEELAAFAEAAFIPEADLQDYGPEYKAWLRERAQAFSDFVYLLAYSGGRDKETRWQKWSNVNWKRRTLLFPGPAAKKGAGREAEDREVDFNAKLEAHLHAMYARRDPNCDWMFPNEDRTVPIGSFRKQLLKVRAAVGMEEVGFHHFRHYFISHAMMSQPYIDVATIAYWVGHRDKGGLILRVYGHLRPGHTAPMAAHVQL